MSDLIADFAAARGTGTKEKVIFNCAPSDDGPCAVIEGTGIDDVASDEYCAAQNCAKKMRSEI